MAVAGVIIMFVFVLGDSLSQYVNSSGLRPATGLLRTTSL